MKILIIGGGGREHAIAAALAKSDKVTELHIAPGNGGISELAVCHPSVKATDIAGAVALANEVKANFVFVAPDDPLVAGMADAFTEDAFEVFGPSKNAAVIEGSKSFSKELMQKYGIPTAAYEVFCDEKKAAEYLEAVGIYPGVVKYDGLALGKGVVIAENFSEARSAVHDMLTGNKFGTGGKVVVEEFMRGVEVTLLVLTDGKTAFALPASTDHKRAFDGDKGLNTGGMGVIAPTPYFTEEHFSETAAKIIKPTVDAMNRENRTFKGCLYFGLMLTEDGVKVVEYNCRVGDPETQELLPLLEFDFFEAVRAVAEERLADFVKTLPQESVSVSATDGVFGYKVKSHSACIVIASGGYPEKYETGFEITGLDSVDAAKAKVYHAGTALKDGGVVSNGGRVINVVGFGESLREAIANAYSETEKIRFDGSFYRKDVGLKALKAI